MGPAVPHVESSGKRVRHRSQCVCECGATLVVPNGALKTGNTLSCGCLKKADPIPIGSVFGRLTIVEEGPRVAKGADGYTCATWHCRCECGNECDVPAGALKRKNNSTVSCGCWQRRQNGDSNSPECKAWASMIDRCYNSSRKDYPRWGGRGIRVCQEWLNSYSAFLADMGRRPSQKHSLDRFPNTNGNYEAGNCRWATAREQANNRRSNRLIEFRGEVKTLAQWAYALGFNHGTINSRLRLGWTAEEAFTATSASNYRNQRRNKKD